MGFLNSISKRFTKKHNEVSKESADTADLGGYPDQRTKSRERLVAERQLNDLKVLLKSPHQSKSSERIETAIWCHLAKDYDNATTILNSLLHSEPENPFALYHLGRSLFNVGKKQEALQKFLTATDLFPEYAEAWNAVGHSLRDAGDQKGAEMAFRRATEISPDFSAAQINLGLAELNAARPKDAEKTFSKLVTLNPGHAEGWLHLGTVQHLCRKHNEAKQSYQTAIKLADMPLPQAQRQLGQLLNEIGNTEESIVAFRLAIQYQPNDPQLQAELISVLELSNRIDEAWQVAKQALERFPRHPLLELESAKLERRLGKEKEGLARLERLVPESIPPHVRQWYYFEYGTALDRAGETDRAFSAFVTSNELAQSGTRAKLTDKQAFDRILDAIEDWLAQGAPEPQLEPDEDLGEDLCFLMGFPRSGTTLLDVMLDGHSQVTCLEERQTMEVIFHDVDSKLGGFPHGYSNSSKADREALRAHYRTLLAQHGVTTMKGQVIVDKMPIRTPYAAFILRLFPAAKLLFSVRHPCDVILSNFMQHYAANDVFVHFYTLPECVRTYARVMRIWQQTTSIFPANRWHYVKYEDLLEDTAGTLQKVCQYLDIPWQTDLSDHRSTLQHRERIRTNSYHQVAEPIYRRAAGRWERYAQYFKPHLSTLKPHIEFFGYPSKSEQP